MYVYLGLSHQPWRYDGCAPYPLKCGPLQFGDGGAPPAEGRFDIALYHFSLYFGCVSYIVKQILRQCDLNH